MLDIKIFRERPDEVREGLRRRGVDVNLVERVLELDRQRRLMVTEVEELKGKRNADSKLVGQRRKAGEDTAELQAGVRAIGERIAELDDEIRAAGSALKRGCWHPTQQRYPTGRTQPPTAWHVW